MMLLIPNLMPHQSNQIFAAKRMLVIGAEYVQSPQALVGRFANISGDFLVAIDATGPFNGLGPDVKGVPGDVRINTFRLLLEFIHPAFAIVIPCGSLGLRSRHPNEAVCGLTRQLDKFRNRRRVLHINQRVEASAGKSFTKLFHEPGCIGRVKIKKCNK